MSALKGLGGYAPSVLDIPLYADKWGRGDEHKPKDQSVFSRTPQAMMDAQNVDELPAANQDAVDSEE